jgi:hypothetical protein
MSGRVQDKLVIITGAGEGLGATSTCGNRSEPTWR